MHDRPTPLPPTPEARLWTVDLGFGGVFPFRFPSFAVTNRLRRYMVAFRDGLTSDPESPQRLFDTLPAMSVLIAAAWWHPDRDLTARLPRHSDPGRLSDEDLTTYGLAVLDELQDLGWGAGVITHVGTACLAEMNRRGSVATMAAELAGFTPPRAEASTVS